MRNSKRHSIEEYTKGILAGNTKIIAKAFTLLENDLTEDQQIASSLIGKLSPKNKQTIRVAITGSPGVGKSSFIETLGTSLCDAGQKVAILAIDPSSKHSSGSILGDKTRMEKLSQHPNAFIRPSASQSSLGGTATSTREGILLCEAAGYNVIFIETVGVGQSETLAAEMTDVFLVLQEPGAGDDIQAIKKGIIEEADILAVTKADLDKQKAIQTAIAYLAEKTQDDWNQPELTISTLEEKDVLKVWDIVLNFISHQKTHHFWEEKRTQQRIFWLHESLKKRILDDLYRQDEIITLITELEEKIQLQEITTFEACTQLIERYKSL